MRISEVFLKYLVKDDISIIFQYQYCQALCGNELMPEFLLENFVLLDPNSFPLFTRYVLIYPQEIIEKIAVFG